MPTVVTCPQCGTSGRLPDAAAVGTLGCPKCGAQFTLGDGGVPVPAPEGEAVWVGASAPPPPMAQAPPDPLAEVTPDTAAAHLDWVRDEVRRFDAYVAEQLTRLARGREELGRIESKVGAEALAREMAVNRDRAVLAARLAALDRQEAELAARRELLERREAEVERSERSVERRLAELDEMEEGVRQDSHAAAVERVRHLLAGVPPKAHGCG